MKNNSREQVEIIVGTDWGDEGKGKITAHRAREFDVVARGNGGCNAGHSIVDQFGQRIVTNAIPSGVVAKNTELYIGSGCVFNPNKAEKEIENLKKAGYELKDRLKISDEVTVITPAQVLRDMIDGGFVGSTSNGIGPAYADRAIRHNGRYQTNIRIADILDDRVSSSRAMNHALSDVIEELKGRNFSSDQIEQILFKLHQNYNLNEGEKINYSIEKVIRSVRDFFNENKFISKDRAWMAEKYQKGARILVEGAQSVRLDVTSGDVPFVTSSGTKVSSLIAGADLTPTYGYTVVGVSKLIHSRVGNGPFVSELGGEKSEKYCHTISTAAKAEEAKLDLSQLASSKDELDIAKYLRIRGNEYGAVTGRPRRIGILDLVHLGQMCHINGIDRLALTKLDCLRDFYSIKKWQGYIPYVKDYNLLTCKIKKIPSGIETLRSVSPSIGVIDSFNEELGEFRDYDKLPPEAKNLVKLIEIHTRSKVEMIGVGPNEDQLIIK